MTAGEPAARDGEGANRFAVITLEHLPVTGEWLAIEGQNLRRRVTGHVIDRHQAEVKVTEGQSEVGCGVVVRIFEKCCAGISGQADVCCTRVGVGMEREINARILPKGYSAQKNEDGREQSS